MKLSKMMIATVCVFWAAFAFAECTAPQSPTDPPDGAKATREEMIAAKKAIDKYQAEVLTYQKCLDQDAQAKVSALGQNAKDEDVKKINADATEKGNAAVDELSKLAAEFNTSLTAYKKKAK